MTFTVIVDKDQLCIEVEERQKPKTIKEKFPTQHDCILKLNNDTDEEDLPPIWH